MVTSGCRGRVGDRAELEVKQFGVDLQQPGDHVRERRSSGSPPRRRRTAPVVEPPGSGRGRPGQPLVGVVLSQAGLDLIELDADDGRHRGRQPFEELSDSRSRADHLDLRVVVGPSVVAEEGTAGAELEQLTQHGVVRRPGPAEERGHQAPASLQVAREGQERQYVGVGRGDLDHAVGPAGARPHSPRQAVELVGPQADRAGVVADVRFELLTELDAAFDEPLQLTSLRLIQINTASKFPQREPQRSPRPRPIAPRPTLSALRTGAGPAAPDCLSSPPPAQPAGRARGPHRPGEPAYDVATDVAFCRQSVMVFQSAKVPAVGTAAMVADPFGAVGLTVSRLTIRCAVSNSSPARREVEPSVRSRR